MAYRLLERAARPLTGISAGAFAALSRMRNKRVFHPIGEAFAGSLTFEARADRWLPDTLARPRTHDVIARFSRGAGLPQVAPDILGLAIKIPDLYGDGWDQDWLFVTSGESTLLRHALLPARRHLGRPYSTVLPYRLGARLVTFGLRPLGAGARTFDELSDLIAESGVELELTIAPENEAHVVIGTVRLSSGWSGGRRLRFNPWNSSSQLRPAGPLNELRRDTYVASQKARPDTDAG